ncbi:MAG TPA: TetR family transcriptional regulator [Candidatus Dormibacteraeota bacterium]|nr:TetR family transcriptional regulator [Candidatus Dormibacteraeota bacterium]
MTDTDESAAAPAATRRAYRSPRRQEQARATRQAILAAARLLFVTEGYAATSREQVARAAGVAAQTVAAVAGTKRALLEAVLDDAARNQGEPLPLALRSWLQDLRDQPDGPSLLRHHARSSSHVSARTAGVMEAVRRGAAADAAIAELWSDLQRQRHRAQATVVELLLQRDPQLRADLDPGEAADVLWALTDDALYHGLVVEKGWSPDRFESWLGDAMCRLLLGEHGAA